MAYGLEAEEVVVTGLGGVYVAPLDTPFPADISSPIGSPWVGLGYVAENGARFSFGRDINEIMAWQSFDPLRLVVTRVPKSIAFDLMQWNQNTVKLALGGGTVTGSSPNFAYEPPDEDFVDERALIVEGQDKGYTYRFCYRRAINYEGVDFAFVRSDPVQFPISMRILAAGAVKPWLLQTDDPNIGDLAEAAS